MKSQTYPRKRHRSAPAPTTLRVRADDLEPEDRPRLTWDEAMAKLDAKIKPQDKTP